MSSSTETLGPPTRCFVCWLARWCPYDLLGQALLRWLQPEVFGPAGGCRRHQRDLLVKAADFQFHLRDLACKTRACMCLLLSVLGADSMRHLLHKLTLAWTSSHFKTRCCLHFLLLTYKVVARQQAEESSECRSPC